MEVQLIAQTFGMVFVGIIVICLVSTILSYIFSKDDYADNNKKLLDNMKKMNKKYK